MKKLILTAMVMVVMATGAMAAEVDAETEAVINNACSGAVSSKPFCGKNRGSLNYLACMQAESKIGEEIYNNKYGALSTEAVGRFGIGVKKVVGWGAVIHSFNLFTETLTPDQTDTLIYILSLPWQAKYGVGWMIIRGQVAGTGEWSKSISAGYVVRSVMETLNTVSKPLPPDYKLFLGYFFSGDHVGLRAFVSGFHSKNESKMKKLTDEARQHFCE